jgi:putative methionine-R-sulfoxide reductase with GAF domain
VSAKAEAYRGVADAVDRMINRGEEADAVLRAVVDLLHERLPHCSRVGISLVEEGALVLGPARGGGAERAFAARMPIEFEGRVVGELGLDCEGFDDEDRRALERITVLISPHALVGWDTAGEQWDP